MFSVQETTTVDYFQGGSAGGGKPNPIHEPELAAFFIVLSARQEDVAVSAKQGEWYVQRQHAELLNETYKNGRKQVMIFFTVSESRHVQGAALMMSMATYQEGVANHSNKETTPTITETTPVLIDLK